MEKNFTISFYHENENGIWSATEREAKNVANLLMAAFPKLTFELYVDGEQFKPSERTVTFIR